MTTLVIFIECLLVLMLFYAFFDKSMKLEFDKFVESYSACRIVDSPPNLFMADVNIPLKELGVETYDEHEVINLETLKRKIERKKRKKITQNLKCGFNTTIFVIILLMISTPILILSNDLLVRVVLSIIFLILCVSYIVYTYCSLAAKIIYSLIGMTLFTILFFV